MKTVTFKEPRQLDKTHLIQLYKYWLCLYIGNELATYRSGPFNYHFFFFFFGASRPWNTLSRHRRCWTEVQFSDPQQDTGPLTPGVPGRVTSGWQFFFKLKWMDCGLSKVFQSNLEKAKNASKEEEHNSIHCFSTWPLQYLGVCLSLKPVSRDLSPKGTEDRGYTLNEGTYCLYCVMCVRVFPPPWRCSVVWEKKWG